MVKLTLSRLWPMEQLEFFEIPSPCIGVCQTDARGYCKGCLRNRDERFNWLTFSDARKTDVIRLCKARHRRRKLALLKARKAQLVQQRAEINPALDFDTDGGSTPSDRTIDFNLE